MKNTSEVFQMLKTISFLSPTLSSEIIDALLLTGVDVESMMRTSKGFFADEKAKRTIPMEDFRGYSQLGSEVTRYEDGKVSSFLLNVISHSPSRESATGTRGMTLCQKRTIRLGRERINFRQMSSDLLCLVITQSAIVWALV
jgi:hypothetical protein